MAYSPPPIVVCLPPVAPLAVSPIFRHVTVSPVPRLRRVHISIWCSSSSSSFASSFRAPFSLVDGHSGRIFGLSDSVSARGFPPSHLIAKPLSDLLFVVLVLSDRLFVLVFVPTSSCSGRFPIVRLLPSFSTHVFAGLFDDSFRPPVSITLPPWPRRCGSFRSPVT